MYNIKNVLVCLDLTEIDVPVLQYASYVSRVLEAKHIAFIHVANEGDEEELEYDIDIPLKEHLPAHVSHHFKNENIKKEVKVLHGDTSTLLLGYIKDNDLDLVVMGDKIEEKGSGSVGEKIARKAPCSVLFVPDNPPFKLEQILVPTDFSSYSKMAFEEVKYFHENLPGLKIHALHIYNVPTGYYKTGKTYEEFAAIMRNNAENDLEEFIQKVKVDDIQIESHFRIQEDSSTAKVICSFANEKKNDLIIIGAKGQTKGSVMLLGSTTEKMLKYNKNIPMMVLKRKGENLGFLEALLKV